MVVIFSTREKTAWIRTGISEWLEEVFLDQTRRGVELDMLDMRHCAMRHPEVCSSTFTEEVFFRSKKFSMVFLKFENIKYYVVDFFFLKK